MSDELKPEKNMPWKIWLVCENDISWSWFGDKTFFDEKNKVVEYIRKDMADKAVADMKERMEAIYQDNLCDCEKETKKLTDTLKEIDRNIAQDAMDESKCWPAYSLTESQLLQFIKKLIAKAIRGEDKCEHGKGVTDYCEPCGRINSA